MRTVQLVFVRCFLALLIVAFVACGGLVVPPPGGSSGEFDGCAATGDADAVTPVVSCVLDEGASRHVVFGYDNEDKKGSVAIVRSGPGNRLDPEPDPRFASGTTRPPSAFLPGKHPMAFATTYLAAIGDLTWHLGKASVSTAGAQTCGKTTTPSGETRLEVRDGDLVAGIVIASDPTRQLSQTIQPTETPFAAMTAAGELAGEFNVSDDGAATYHIPLWVPPGRAGMEPALALDYGSGAANGPAGVGWTLSGLSQIARCPASATTKKAARPIQFKDPLVIGQGDRSLHIEGDQFCLDGDPLLVGTDGSLFPQRDPYTRVRPTMVNGKITSFQVELRSGRVMQYGDEATISGALVATDADGHEVVADFATRPRVTLAWLLKEVSDRSGNSMRYSYSDNSFDRTSTCAQGHDPEPWKPCFAYEVLPNEITYTHGGLGAKKRVHFKYDDRNDADVMYVSGFPLKRSHRLTKVFMYGPQPAVEGLLREYRLDYIPSPMNGRSLLSAVSECDGSGVCKPATTFNYEPGSTTFKEEKIGDVDQAGGPDFFVSGQSHLLVADFNGDGYDDLVYSRQGGWYSRRRSADGKAYEAEVAIDLPLQRAGNCGVFGVQLPEVTAQDVDADGIPEIIYPQLICYANPKGGTYLGLAYRVFGYNGTTGVQFVPKSGYDVPPPETFDHDWDNVRFDADLDGDGQSDTWYIFNGSPAAWTVVSGLYKDARIQAPEPTSAAPFAVPIDGTSRARLLIANGERYALADFDHPTKPLVPTLLPTTDSLISFSDLNGDGSADALVRSTLPLVPDFLAVSTGTGSGFRKVNPAGDSPNSLTAWSPRKSIVRFDFLEDGHAGWLTGQLLTDHPLAAPYLQPGNLYTPPTWTAAPHVPSSNWESIGRVGDANGDGLDDLFIPYDNALRVFVREGQRADLLTKIHSGLGDETSISYAAPRVNATIAPGHECAWPLRCSVRGMVTTSQVTYHSSNASAKRVVAYAYQDAASNALTGEFVGFRLSAITDVDIISSTAVAYDRRNVRTDDSDGRVTFFEARAPTTIEQLTQVGTKLLRTKTSVAHEVVNPPFAPNSYAVRPTQTVVEKTEEAGAVVTVLHRSTSTSAYDDYGNVKSTSFDVPSLGTSETTTQTWQPPDLNRWLIARPKHLTTRSRVAGLSIRTETREQDFETEPSTGLISKVTEEPVLEFHHQQLGDPSLQLETTILRVAGMPRSIAQTDSAGNVRQIDFEYDSIDGTLPVSTTDPLGYVRTFIYHSGLGVLAETTDPNGVRSRLQYDGFGRLRKRLAPQCSGYMPPGPAGSLCGGSSTTYSFIAPPGPEARAHGVFAVQVTQPGSPTAVTSFDELGRVVNAQEDGFELPLIRSTSIQYDPVFTYSPKRIDAAEVSGSGLSRATLYLYDAVGRVTSVTAPDKGVTSYDYSGLTVTVTAEGAVAKAEFDQLGRTVKTTEFTSVGTATPSAKDALVTRREYGPFGLLTRMVDPLLNAVEYHYDRRGRMTLRSDVDSNSTTYAWNAFGELVEKTDAKGRTTTLGYDALGRTIGTKSVDGLSCYQYDAGTGAVGRRTFASRRDDRSDGSDMIITSTEYDPLGRPSAAHQQINEGPDRVTTFGYDEFGRAQLVTFPSIAGRALTLQNTYADHGHLKSVTGAFGDGGKPTNFWQKTSENIAGELTSETFGNGVATTYTRDFDTGRVLDLVAKHDSQIVQSTRYQWYRDGNLRQLDDFSAHDVHGRALHLTEQFQYDGAKRLIDWRGPWGSVTYGYDKADNLTSRKIAPSTGATRTEDFVPGPQGLARIGLPTRGHSLQRMRW